MNTPNYILSHIAKYMFGVKAGGAIDRVTFLDGYNCCYFSYYSIYRMVAIAKDKYNDKGRFQS